MKLLHRYIFFSVLSSSLASLALFVFILLAGNLLKDVMSEFAAGRMTGSMFLQLILLLVPYVIAYALPLGVLTGVLIVLGRLSSGNEIVAMKSAGVSLWSIAAPILLVATLGMTVAMSINCYFAPRAKAQYRTMLANLVRNDPMTFFVPKTFVHEFPGYVIYVGEKEGSVLHDFWVWELNDEQRVVKFCRANEGQFSYDEVRDALQLSLIDAVCEASNPDDLQESRPIAQFDEVPAVLPLESIWGDKTKYRKRSAMTFWELGDRISELKSMLGLFPLQTREVAALERLFSGISPDLRDDFLARVRRMAVEEENSQVQKLPDSADMDLVWSLRKEKVRSQMQMQENFAMAVSVFAITFIGIPLGIRVGRKETYLNVVMALGLALGYNFLMIAVGWLEKKPDFRPDLLIWLPNVLFFALGMVLLWRAGRH